MEKIYTWKQDKWIEIPKAEWDGVGVKYNLCVPNPPPGYTPMWRLR